MGPGDHIGDGKFEVVRTLGEGGIATVYHVRNVALDVPNAIKVLHVSTQAMRDRLIIEGRIQARLKHKNVVQVVDVVQHEGQVGLVMEFVEGFSLAECLKEEGAMETEDALALFRQILAGVRAAHELSVTHRDLKPANILLTTSDDGEVLAKITDFGIAKVMHASGDDRTRANTAMGTPGYMAPEQIRDSSQVDHRADIFALGSILYEMLSGRRAFKGRDSLATMNLTVAGSHSPLADVLDKVDERVAGAVERALQAEPEERFASCGEFEEALFGNAPVARKKSLPLAPKPFVFSAPTHTAAETRNPTLMPDRAQESGSTLFIDGTDDKGAPDTSAPLDEDVEDEATDPGRRRATAAPTPSPAASTPSSAKAQAIQQAIQQTMKQPARPVSTPEAEADPSRVLPPPPDGTPKPATEEEEERPPSSAAAGMDVPGVEGNAAQRFVRAVNAFLAPFIYAVVTMLKWFGPGILAVTVGTGFYGQHAAKLIDEHQRIVETRTKATVQMMEKEIDVADQVAEISLNPDLIRAMKVKYKSEPDPAKRAKIGKELYQMLETQLGTLPAATDPVEQTKRRELELAVSAALAAQVELEKSEAELLAVRDSASGRVATRLGMVEGPDE